MLTFSKKNVLTSFLLAQGPLMITGPGMGVYPPGGFSAGTYPQYGGAPGYSGY